MRPADLLLLVKAEPFQPFRVVMTHGPIYEVRHPEFVKVGRSSWEYYHVPPPDGPAERYDILPYLLMAGSKSSSGRPCRIAAVRTPPPPARVSSSPAPQRVLLPPP